MSLRSVYVTAARKKLPLPIVEAELPLAAIVLLGSGMKMPKTVADQAREIMAYIVEEYDMLLPFSASDPQDLIIDEDVTSLFDVSRGCDQPFNISHEDVVKIVTYSGRHDWDPYNILQPLQWLYHGIARNVLEFGDLLALVLESQTLSSLVPSRNGQFAIGEMIPTFLCMSKLPPARDTSGNAYGARLSTSVTTEMEVMARLLPILCQLCIPRLQAMRLVTLKNEHNCAKWINRSSLACAIMGEMFKYVSYTVPGLIGMRNLYLFTRMLVVMHYCGVVSRKALGVDAKPTGLTCVVCRSYFDIDGDEKHSIYRHLAMCPFSTTAASLLIGGKVLQIADAIREPEKYKTCSVCGSNVLVSNSVEHEKLCCYIFDKCLNVVPAPQRELPFDTCTFYCITCKQVFITLNMDQPNPSIVSASHYAVCGTSIDCSVQLRTVLDTCGVFRCLLRLNPKMTTIADLSDGLYVPAEPVLDPSLLMYALLNACCTPLGGTLYGRPKTASSTDEDALYYPFVGQTWKSVWDYLGKRVSIACPLRQMPLSTTSTSGTTTPAGSEDEEDGELAFDPNIALGLIQRALDERKENRLSLRDRHVRRRKGTPRRLVHQSHSRDSSRSSSRSSRSSRSRSRSSRSRSRSRSRKSRSRSPSAGSSARRAKGSRMRSCSPSTTARTRRSSRSRSRAAKHDAARKRVLGASPRRGAKKAPRKPPSKKAPKKAPPKKAPPKKAPPKKAPPKQAPPPKKAPPPPKKAPPKKTPLPTPAKKASSRKTPVKTPPGKSLPLRRRRLDLNIVPRLSLTSMRKMCRLAGVSRVESGGLERLRDLSHGYIERYVDVVGGIAELARDKRLNVQHFKAGRDAMDRKTFPYRTQIPIVYGDTIESGAGDKYFCDRDRDYRD